MPNIVVCIKAVPKDLDVHISSRTGEVSLAGAQWSINAWEKRAITLALELVEKDGGAVTVLTMDESSATMALREGLAMGADKAILLNDKDFEGADTLATARVLAAAISKLRADIVLTGSRTADRRSAQVGPMLGQLLNIPAVTFVHDLAVDGRQATAKKRIREKVATYEVDLPALFSVSDEVGKPRIATAWGVYDAYATKDVQVWNRRDLDLHPDSVGKDGSPTRVRRQEKLREERRASQECEFFEGDADEVARSFVRRLRSRGLVR